MIENIFSIKIIKRYLLERRIDWTKHCLKRLNQRHISILDIKFAIDNGKIIEEYSNDYPCPSCLILGKDRMNRKLHIVCSISNKNDSYDNGVLSK